MPTVTVPASGSDILVSWAQEVATAINSMFPVGHIIEGFFSSDPTDYLRLDGRELSRTGIYAALYAAVGPYGGPGNGTTTWTLPNMANRFLMGIGASPAVALGGMGGSKDQTVTSHSHTINSHTHSGTSADQNQTHVHWVNGVGTHTHTVFTTGGGGNIGLTGGASLYNWGASDHTTAGGGAHDHGNTGNAHQGHTHTFTTGDASNRGTDTVGVTGIDANLPPYMGVAFAVKYR